MQVRRIGEFTKKQIVKSRNDKEADDIMKADKINVNYPSFPVKTQVNPLKKTGYADANWASLVYIEYMALTEAAKRLLI